MRRKPQIRGGRKPINEKNVEWTVPAWQLP
jgi:hypothetical protein